MKVFNKDWIIDLQKSILWQYDKAQKLSDIIIQKGVWYKSNVTDFVVDFFWNIFNLRTANDFGLNIWGKILNFPRQIVLSYGEHAGEVYELSKEQYRFLLIGQVLKFQMDTTITEINKYLSVIFPNNNGTCYVIDNQDMTINYSIAEGFLTDEIKVLVDNYEFLPRPAGVKITVGTTGTYILRLEVISEGVPTIQFPTYVQLSITKNGTTVEPIISDNGYEITVSSEDVLSWQLTYNGTVIDSNSNFTISQNTTQYGYISRRLQINFEPSNVTSMLINIYGRLLRYVENNVVIQNNTRTFSGSIDVYVMNSSSFTYMVTQKPNDYSGRSSNILDIDEDINLTIHLLPSDMKVKSLNVYNNRSIALFDILDTQIDETGSYKVTLKGEQGGLSGVYFAEGYNFDIEYYDNGNQIQSAGGIIEFNINLTKNDNIKVKRINGGHNATHTTTREYIGGSGVALWINDELIAVVGGGANGGTMTPQYNSAGGGGYVGGLSTTNPSDSFYNGFSVDGTRGNSTIENQNACGSNAYLNSTTRTSGYGGSSYIKDSDSRISNITEVYGKRENDSDTGNIVAGNMKEGRVTITKNS